MIRALVESSNNPVVSIHDHGAGGHLNCLSELVEATGGTIELDKLPVGDPTLSAKEIVGNESQERMGLVVKEKDIDMLRRIADRERSPMYVVGEATGDMQFRFVSEKTGKSPIDLQMSDMFGSAPKTVMEDVTVERSYADAMYVKKTCANTWKNVLQMEAVACKDYLTNKADRCVTGKVARQQNVGALHLPLSDVGVVALDYRGVDGIATSIGHAPVEALIDPRAGSRPFDSRSANQYRVRTAYARVVRSIAQRQLDVALPQRRRGCAVVFGRGSRFAVCDRTRSERTYGKRLAFDDTEIQGRNEGHSSRYGDNIRRRTGQRR